VLLLSASALKKLAENLCDYLSRRQEEEGEFAVGTISCERAREDLVELVETVERAGGRIRDTVVDLKEFARKEKAVVTQLVDINKVTQAGVKLLQPIINKATQNFSADYAEDLPPVTANAQRVEQVVVNLIGNACQALTGPNQAVRVVTRLDRARERVIVCVEDEGAGIPPENLKRITDPFFTTKHDTGGTGLGLSISRKIIEEYGGKLQFESEPGAGTRACIVLPAANEE
jgi:polar amino acid transport system substrate-binding protein